MRTLGAVNLVLAINVGAFAYQYLVGASFLVAAAASAVSVLLSVWAVGLARHAGGRRLWASFAVASCLTLLLVQSASPITLALDYAARLVRMHG